MQTERLTLLVTKEFKTRLHQEAHRRGMSVSQLVRTNCGEADPEQAALAELTTDVARVMAEAQKTLRRGIQKTDEVLTELHSKRSKQQKNGATSATES
jgi:hypothetical protein